MRRLLSVFLLFALLAGLCCHAAAESAAPGKFSNAEGYVYTLKEDGTAEITGYTGKEKKLEIPSELDGHTVTSIGYRAFYENKQLTEAVLPDTIKVLGVQAFAWCEKLQSVSLPEGLESIKTNVFYCCKKLVKVNIPASATEVMEGAFPGCISLKEITLAPDHPFLELADGILFNKETAALLWYPATRKGKEYTVPEGTKRIGIQAFYSSPLEKIILPDSIEELPGASFEECTKLKTVNIPPKVTSLDGAFKYCDKLEAINVDEGNEVFESIDGVLFDKTARSLIKYPVAKKGKTYAVPEGTLAIMPNAFEDTTLTGVTIPGSVRLISNNAFLFCKSLKEIVLPEGVEELGHYAFQWCSALVKAVLPASLATVGRNPFMSCEKLSEIVLAEGNTALETVNGCLVRKEDMAIVCCPQSLKAKQLEFPAGIRRVENSAFAYCKTLEEVTFGDGLEELQTSAFRQCKKLKRVVLPASVTNIDRTAFDLDDVVKTVFVVAPGSYAENFFASYGLTTEPAE